MSLEPKEHELMCWLWERQFAELLADGSKSVKAGVTLTVERMHGRDYNGMWRYYYACIEGTDRSVSFRQLLDAEQLPSFESNVRAFQERFPQKWLTAAPREVCPTCGTILISKGP
jgi:hypothetical protein